MAARQVHLVRALLQTLVRRVLTLLSCRSQVDATRQDYASLLAGYSITLIRCFPDKADDIRMRLFLADFPTRSGAQPAVQFFWAASSATKLFDSILASPKGALDFLLRRKYFPASSSASADDSPWDREWRTVLLFLELYTFVMRLTDDEDFFSGFNKSAAAGHASVGASSSHVRASSLPLRALERLSLFLKNLAFTLNYNAAELLQGSGSDGAMQAGPGQRQHEQREPAGTYHVIAGVDFGPLNRWSLHPSRCCTNEIRGDSSCQRDTG